MTQSRDVNRRWVLASRPEGEPVPANWRLERAAVPEPGPGQMLLRTVWLSLDPYMRGRMSDAPSYAPPVGLGEVMVGGAICRVERSNLEGFAPGDWVIAYTGWQDWALSDGEGVVNLGPAPEHPSLYLGVLGMPGFTAWAGLTEIGRPQPGETLVVAAATGAVGSTVGQLARLRGCRVVGIAGGPAKCRFAVEELGFDACIDHRAPDFAERLAEATPDGIDIYWENVGGKVLEAVVPRLNPGGRVPVCGLISMYNATALPPGPDRLGWFMGHVLRRRLTVRGFIIWLDFGHLWPDFLAEMKPLVENGSIRVREEVIEGLEAAPEGLIGLLRGENFGKRVVRVGPDAL